MKTLIITMQTTSRELRTAVRSINKNMKSFKVSLN